MFFLKLKMMTICAWPSDGGRADLVDLRDALQRLLDAVDDLALDRLGRGAGVGNVAPPCTGCSTSGIWFTRRFLSASSPRHISTMMMATVVTGRLMLKSERNMAYFPEAVASDARSTWSETNRPATAISTRWPSCNVEVG